jgi:hypothetical protein
MIYTVRGGDTLSGIGARFGVPWQWIYNQNMFVIGPNPNVIGPGQRLYIPCKNPGSRSVPLPNPQEPSNSGGSNNGGSSGGGNNGNPGTRNDLFCACRERLKAIEGLPDFHVGPWEFTLPVQIPEKLFEILKLAPISIDLKDMALEFQWETHETQIGGLYCVTIDATSRLTPPKISASFFKVLSAGSRSWGHPKYNLTLCEDGSVRGSARSSAYYDLTLSIGGSVKDVIGLSLDANLFVELYSELVEGKFGANIEVNGTVTAAIPFVYATSKPLVKWEWHPHVGIPKLKNWLC